MSGVATRRLHCVQTATHQVDGEPRAQVDARDFSGAVDPLRFNVIEPSSDEVDDQVLRRNDAT